MQYVKILSIAVLLLEKLLVQTRQFIIPPPNLKGEHFRRGALLEGAFCTEVDVRELEESRADVMRRCLLKPYKKN